MKAERWSILKEEYKDGSSTVRIAMVEFSPDLPDENKVGSAWSRHVQRTFDLNQEERDDLERKIYGKGPLVKSHPMKWTMHEFVEYVKALEVEEAPRPKKRFKWEKERCLNELSKYIREALENLDYVGFQALGRIFEKAVTWEGSYTASDMVKARQVMKNYFEKTIDGMIAEAGYPTRKRHLHWSAKPPPQSTKSIPELRVSKVERKGTIFLGYIPNPTRIDLEAFLDEPDRPRIEQIARAARAMGYTIINMPPWGSTR